MVLRVVEAGAGREDEAQRNERALILAAQSGQTDAFRELYERYRDRIYNVIYYSLNDVHHAEDVLQNVFVKVFQTLAFFRMESSFPTWLYRVAVNECKNANRRRRLFVPFLNKGDIAPVDPSPRPDVVHASLEHSRIVKQAVRQLKPRYRTVVVLRYVEEMSYEQIAGVLGCSSGTVASRLSRALEILHDRLRPLV